MSGYRSFEAFASTRFGANMSFRGCQTLEFGMSFSVPNIPASYKLIR